MAEKIRDNIYRIKIPLPGLELDQLNSYLLESGKELLLIDLGPDQKNSLEKIKRELKNDINKVKRILFTHFHPDHIGMFKKFRENSERDIKARLSLEETKFMKEYLEEFDTFWDKQIDFARSNGVPEDFISIIKDLKPNPSEKEIYRDIINSNEPLESDEEIKIGDNSLETINTPGHSPGHVCYYDSEKNLLFAGDLLLRNTTPSVVQMKSGKNPLANYLESLNKIKDLEVKLVLPSHGDPYHNHKLRIEELFSHHEERLSKIKKIIGDGRATPYEIAREVDWDVNFPSWEEFPIFQKWLATGETIAHLSLLESENEVIEMSIKDTKHYSLI